MKKGAEKMTEKQELYFDHLVIGSGLAGLSSALTLAETCTGEIAVVTKGAIDDCNSRLAQGGIACVTTCPGVSMRLMAQSFH